MNVEESPKKKRQKRRRHKGEPIWDTLGWEIYLVLRDWAVHEGTIPNMHSFHANVLTLEGKGYTDVNFSTYRYWWDELQIEGLIRHERRTNAPVIVPHQQIFDPQLQDRVAELELKDIKTRYELNAFLLGISQSLPQHLPAEDPEAKPIKKYIRRDDF